MDRGYVAWNMAEASKTKFVDPIAIGKDNIGFSFDQVPNFFGDGQI